MHSPSTDPVARLVRLTGNVRWVCYGAAALVFALTAQIAIAIPWHGVPYVFNLVSCLLFLALTSPAIALCGWLLTRASREAETALEAHHRSRRAPNEVSGSMPVDRLET